MSRREVKIKSVCSDPQYTISFLVSIRKIGFETEVIMLNFDVLVSEFSLQVGAGCLIGHLGLVWLFRQSQNATSSSSESTSPSLRAGGTTSIPLQPWSQMPSFTAHQVMCFPVLGSLTIEGIRHWFFPAAEVAATATERILMPRNIHISQFVFGMMLFWDLPCGIFTPALRNTAMLFHHIGMLFVAGMALGCLSGGVPILGHYAPFFFGVIEVSSFPLILVDLFHPKHKPWHEYLTQHAPSWMASLNESCRIVFALSFLILRAVYFPYVSYRWVVPDLLEMRQLPVEQRQGVTNLPFDAMIVFCTLFAALQMYWGFLIVRQIVKLITGKPSKDPNKRS